MGEIPQTVLEVRVQIQNAGDAHRTQCGIEINEEKFREKVIEDISSEVEKKVSEGSVNEGEEVRATIDVSLGTLMRTEF